MQIVYRLGFGAALLWFVWASLDSLAFPNDANGLLKLSQWGGSFGGLSAFISAAGFLAVIWSISRQQKDQHRQRFHGQYIELLKLLREVRSDVRFKFSDAYRASYNVGNDPIEGLMAFRAAWREIESHLDTNDSPETIRDLYIDNVHRRYESNLGPYFRLLYTILNNISSDNVLNKNEKEMYGNLLRSQLTSFELVIVGLNGLGPFSKDMSRLLLEYRVLRYIPDGERKRTLVKCYPPEMFLPRS